MQKWMRKWSARTESCLFPGGWVWKPSKWTNLCRDVTWGNLLRSTHLKIRKSLFSTQQLWPMTLIFELIWDLSRSIPPPNFGSICQTVQPWERWVTDRHTHINRTDFIPSTADIRGKKTIWCLFLAGPQLLRTKWIPKDQLSVALRRIVRPSAHSGGKSWQKVRTGNF